MISFSKREKVFIGIIGILTFLTLFLLFKIADYKIQVLSLELLNRDCGPPLIEDLIEDAGTIFLGIPEVQQDTIKYKIKKILFKDKQFDFPYALGYYYPPIQKKPKPGINYSGDQLVIIRATELTSFRMLLVDREGFIPGLGDIGIEEFISKVNEIKKTNS